MKERYLRSRLGAIAYSTNFHADENDDSKMDHPVKSREGIHIYYTYLRMIIYIFWFAMAAIFAISPAAAQTSEELPEINSKFKKQRPPPKGSTYKADRARRVIAKFMRCTVKRFPNRAENLLKSARYSAEAQEIKQTLFGSIVNPCAARSGTVSQTELAFRGAVAENLYKNKYGKGQWLQQIGGLNGELNSVPFIVKPDTFEEAVIYAAVFNFAQCIARTDPVNADFFIKTKVTKPEEVAALRRLIPAMEGCIMQGHEIKITAGSLRPAIAEALYYYADVQVNGLNSSYVAVPEAEPISDNGESKNSENQ